MATDLIKRASRTSAPRKVHVLVVDDSALMRRMLTDLLETDPEIVVVGAAADPYAAREKIKRLNPDVLTLDVEMPRMDGVTFLSNLMRLRPMPVVMISSLTEQGADVTLDALALGAIDFVTKPKIDLAHSMADYAAEIVSKVKMAARVDTARLAGDALRGRTTAKLPVDAVLPVSPDRRNFKTTDTVIAIGASTGGTEAIKDVLLGMPADAPGTVIAQHIPPAFSAMFAQRLDGLCALRVMEAADGDHIVPGHVYIAPGGQHLMVERDGARYVCRLNDGPAVNRHKPSVDVMFRSIAQNVGPNALGVILTGMGDDGARGLKEMRDAGAPTIAQDEASSVVWGMPGEAVKRGGAASVLPLGDIAPALCSRITASPGARAMRHEGSVRMGGQADTPSTLPCSGS